MTGLTCNSDGGWCLDKRVSVSNIIALVMAACAVIGVYYNLDNRLNNVEQAVAEISSKVSRNTEGIQRIERIDERTIQIQRAVDEINKCLHELRARP